MQVWDYTDLGYTKYNAKDVGKDILGCVVENNVLQSLILSCFQKQSVEIDRLKDELERAETDHKQLQEDHVENNKQQAKLRMRLCGTKAQLDVIHHRYKQVIDESDTMNKKYEEAAAILKDRLASKGMEVLHLKKQLTIGFGKQK